jgi:hypothetical protein
MTTTINNLLYLINERHTNEKESELTLKAGTGRRIVELESLAMY